MKKKLLASLAIGLTLLSTTPVFAGQWRQDTTGYWYQNDDGSYPAASWKSIDGKWYYFKSDGYMATGWIKVNGQWYYCESSGEVRTADLPTDVMTFRFSADGACVNFYENTVPSTQAGWANYGTTSLSTWVNAIANGDIVYYNGHYWAKPDYVNGFKDSNVVYFHDVSADGGQSSGNHNRYGMLDWDVDDDSHDDHESLTGFTTDDVD